MTASELKNVEKSYLESWNRIVNILSSIMEMDVALINSVDGDELEVLKTGGRLDNAFQENIVYDLDEVYCEAVVNNKEMVEINNAAENERWQDYKGFDFGLVSYLGFPIFNSKEEVVGTICVENREEKYFKESDKELLREFKEVIEGQLKQLELSQKLAENIERGRHLHEKFLPARLPQIPGLTFGTYYQAADRLGGDFYDIIELENKILFYVSDVSGHDLSSSMLNIFLKEAVNSYLIYQQQRPDYLSPGNIMENIDERFKEESFPADYFISLVLGTIDLDNFEVKLSNAGFHFPPYIIQPGGGVASLTCHSMPINMLEQDNKHQFASYQLQPGETLYISTDGLIEQKDEQGNSYDETRLIELLLENTEAPPETMLEKICEDFFEFKGKAKLEDDLTALLIQRQKSG